VPWKGKAIPPRFLLPVVLLAGCAGSKAVLCPDPGSAAVATIGVTKITADQLDKDLATRPKLSKQVYDAKSEALESMIVDRLLRAEAARRGISPEALLQVEVEKKTAPPSDIEVQRFYDQELAGSGYKLEEVRTKVAGHLIVSRRRAAFDALVENLKSQADVKILLEAPKVSVSATGPSLGPENASVTIIEFSDFQCPYCQKQQEALKQLLAEHPKDVRLVFRDFPLKMHPNAAAAAEAGACADEQGRFWAMHDLLFENRENLATTDLKRYARTAGLDGPQFDGCLDSGKTQARIAASLEEGERVGVEGTPALFINGRMFSGTTSYTQLKQTVEEELKK
jgi:protein-disulfide isomerase